MPSHNTAANEAFIAYCNLAIYNRTGGDMAVIADNSIMFNKRLVINDTVFSDVSCNYSEPLTGGFTERVRQWGHCP